MRKKDNGNIVVCCNNLINTYEGEVPFAREKGIDPSIIDEPLLEAKQDMVIATEEVLEIYEPRADTDDITMNAVDSNGTIRMELHIHESEE